jgi:UDPglucose 6-dehydrogenase
VKIAVIGSGYVGLVTGTCLAEMGNEVICLDIDQAKINSLNKGIIPIYEPGLTEMVKTNLAEGRLNFSTNLPRAIKESLFVFIAVGTPPGEDGSADLQYVLDVAREIGSSMEKYLIVINKSTVPVGTAQKVRQVIEQQLATRQKSKFKFDVVSNPEFLREGEAVNDFLEPDRVIIGTDSSEASEHLRELYAPFVENGNPILFMDILSAELTKYAANAMLASRISFMNELSHLCDATGANIEMVRRGIGSDNRIGMPFLHAGLGYGGSCFPKDVKALIQTFKEKKLDSYLLSAVSKVNQRQRDYFLSKILNYFKNDLSGLTMAVWGLAFKPHTDDMREAPSIDVINALRSRGVKIKVYDPVAIKTARKILGEEQIEYLEDEYEVLAGAEALLLLTEWPQFKRPDFNRVKSIMKKNLIFDGRNQYRPQKMKELGFTYFSIGR